MQIMKWLYSILFISVLTTSSIAGDLASSFKQAARSRCTRKGTHDTGVYSP